VGKNSILIYCVSEVCSGYFPLKFDCPEAHWQLLTMNIVAVAYLMLLAYVAASKGFYLRI
jgi:hypothetical protein